MAGGGAKKRADDNRRKLGGLAAYILACAALHGAVRLWLRGASATGSSYGAFAGTLAVQGLAFISIYAVGRPGYDARGALVHGGGDLSKGMITYYFDVAYVTGFVQAVAAFTRWGWYIYLVVPGFASYMLATKVIKPWLASAYVDDDAPPGGVDAETMRKWERTEKRAERRRRGRI